MTPTESKLSRATRVLCAPVDVAWLAAYRVLFGVALAISMQRFLTYGWVDELLVAPRFRFHYWGFGWVEPLSRSGMHALFVGLVGLGLAVAAGLAFRVTAPLFALGLTYIQLIDVSTYLNHYYLAGLLAWLLACSPAARRWSVDAWVAKRLGRERPPEVARAWLWLFRVQVGVVYVFAGLAKLQPDWLLHGQPLGIWLGSRTELPLLGALFTLPGAPLVMSWFGFLFDTTIVAWLAWPRTRLFAYAVVLTFHVMTRVLFDIGMFPVIMSLSALVFFSPSWPRVLLRRAVPAPVARATGVATTGVATTGVATTGVATTGVATTGVAEREPAPVSRWTRAALALGVLYCAAQIVMPLRCHFYGGNVLWHEQGMRFSWRVMVRAKGGATTFFVRETATGREHEVNPRSYLTRYQENEMASQPDLVLQLARHVRDDYERRGVGPVEVRAESRVSLNGRPGALMVDPHVDLARESDGLAFASWIRPAPPDAPPATRPVR